MIYLTKYSLHYFLLMVTLTWAIFILTPLWFKNLNKKVKTKWILVVVVNERNPVNVCYKHDQFIVKTGNIIKLFKAENEAVYVKKKKIEQFVH